MGVSVTVIFSSLQARLYELSFDNLADSGLLPYANAAELLSGSLASDTMTDELPYIDLRHLLLFQVGYQGVAKAVEGFHAGRGPYQDIC